MRQVRRLPASLPTVALLIAVAWLVGRGGVPLYDGLGFPDEPYRFVSAPAGVKHGPPPSPRVTATSPLVNGINTQRVDPQSREQGPQILVILSPGALHAAAGATSVTAVASPLAPDVQPADGRIDGNVYRVELQAEPPGAVTLAAGSGPALIYLRAVSLKPADPVLEFRPASGAPWRPLHTSRGGRDVFVGAFAAAGDYALVHQRGAKADPQKRGSKTLLALLLGTLALVAATLLAVRRRAGRQGQGREHAGEPANSSQDSE